MTQPLYETFEAAVFSAQRELDADPALDRVMILPTELALGDAVPRWEGTTAFVRCSDLNRHDWHILTRDHPYPFSGSDGVALMATDHPTELPEITPQMVAAGLKVVQEKVYLSTETMVRDIYTAMVALEPGFDIGDDALEDMPAPQALVDAETLRLARALTEADGSGDWEGDDRVDAQARYLKLARAALEATWGKLP